MNGTGESANTRSDAGHIAAGSSLLPISSHVDERGRLVELPVDGVPFPIRRAFVISGVPPGTVRGGHRHRTGSQVLFCLTGRVEVELRRAGESGHVVLTPDRGGLCIPAGTWSQQHYAAPGSSLLVLASRPYDPSEYDEDDGTTAGGGGDEAAAR